MAALGAWTAAPSACAMPGPAPSPGLPLSLGERGSSPPQKEGGWPRFVAAGCLGQSVNPSVVREAALPGSPGSFSLRSVASRWVLRVL